MHYGLVFGLKAIHRFHDQTHTHPNQSKNSNP